MLEHAKQPRTRKYLFTTIALLFIILNLKVSPRPIEAHSSPNVLWKRTIFPASVNSIAFGNLEDITVLVVGGADGNVYLFDGSNGLLVRSVELTEQGSIEKIYVGKFSPNGPNILVCTSKNWILLGFDGYQFAEGVSKPRIGRNGQYAILLDIGDFDHDGYKNILYYVYWHSYNLDHVYVTKDPLESLDPENPLETNYYVKRGEAIAGLLCDVSLIGDVDAFLVTRDGYLHRLSGNKEAYHINIGGEAYHIISGDFDGNMKPDILVCRDNGTIYALEGMTGRKLWTANLPLKVTSVFSTPFTSDEMYVHALHEASRAYMHYTTAYVALGCENGFVYALSGLNGVQLWSFNVGGLVRENALDKYDWNMDGTLDVVAGSTDGNIYVLDGRYGELLWKYNVGSDVSSVRIGDVNDDKIAELVVGTVKGDIIVLGPLPYLDLIPPKISVISPVNGSLFAVENVTVKWFSSDNIALSRFEVRIDDADWINVGVETAYTFTNVTEGIHNVYVRVFDKARNVNEDSVSFMVDTTPPIVSITSPINGSIVTSSKVTIRWDGFDKTSGIENFKVRLDKDSWISLGANFSSYTFNNLNDGIHIVHVKAVDKTGHSSEDSIVFTVKTSLISRMLSLMPLWGWLALALIVVTSTIVFLFYRKA